MFSSISTSDFFILALVLPVGFISIALLGAKFILDMRAENKALKGTMAVRNK